MVRYSVPPFTWTSVNIRPSGEIYTKYMYTSTIYTSQIYTSQIYTTQIYTSEIYTTEKVFFFKSPASCLEQSVYVIDAAFTDNICCSYSLLYCLQPDCIITALIPPQNNYQLFYWQVCHTCNTCMVINLVEQSELEFKLSYWHEQDLLRDLNMVSKCCIFWAAKVSTMFYIYYRCMNYMWNTPKTPHVLHMNDACNTCCTLPSSIQHDSSQPVSLLIIILIMAPQNNYQTIHTQVCQHVQTNRNTPLLEHLHVTWEW